MSSFSEFALLPSLQATLAEKGITTPTEIQARAIPLLLRGQSLIGVSETGSGKTLAFSLPILHRLKTLETEGQAVTDGGRPRAAILVPTRELGEQVTRVLKTFTHATRLRVRSVLGGTKFQVAKESITGNFEILVATPGRLIQLIDRQMVTLNDVRMLVFDEADRMLDQGFLPVANRLAGECATNRQMALFSATVPAIVQELMDKLFAGVETIRSAGSHHVVPTLSTINRGVPDGKRFPHLEEILKTQTPGGTLIFTNTRAQCDALAELLRESGRNCEVYRGEMDKVERRANLKAFRDGKLGLLISTDLGSRGLDLDHVERVINYHLPADVNNYLHRVGRTARAGRKGLVINLVTERDTPLLTRLEKLAAANARAQG